MLFEVELKDLYPYFGTLLMLATIGLVYLISNAKAERQEKAQKDLDRHLQELRDLRGFVEHRLAEDYRPIDDRYALMGVAGLLYHLEAAYRDLGPEFHASSVDNGLDKILPAIRKATMDIVHVKKPGISLVVSNGVLIDKNWEKAK